MCVVTTNPSAVHYCRCDNSVKEMSPVSAQVRLGCQFQSMFGERGPSTADPVLYLGSFEIRECDHLSQMFDFSFGHPVNLDFFQPV